MKSSDEQDNRYKVLECKDTISEYSKNASDSVETEHLLDRDEIQTLRRTYEDLERRVVLLERKLRTLKEYDSVVPPDRNGDHPVEGDYVSNNKEKSELGSDNFSFIIKKLEDIMEANDFRRVYNESEDIALEIMEFAGGNNERVAAILEAIKERMLSICFENPKDFEHLEERFRIHVNFLDNQIMVEMWLCNFLDFIYKQRFIGRYGSVKSVFDYIDEHIKEFINMIAITENCHLSQQYLLRLFKERMKMSALEYIQSRKMMLAKWYLYFEEYSTLDVAAKLGYVDAGYFSKVFRKYVGLTPHQYRLKVRGR